MPYIEGTKMDWTVNSFGMDQYVSWSLSTIELILYTIWGKFCKPQSNEVRARLSTDEWYNAVQIQVALAKCPQKQPRSFTGTSFGSFLKAEEFVSKTINYSNIDLNYISASKIRQLVKKMES